MWPCSTVTEVTTRYNLHATHTYFKCLILVFVVWSFFQLLLSHLSFYEFFKKFLLRLLSLALFLSSSHSVFFASGEDSDSDSDLSLEEERSLSIPSSESEDNVRLRGRIQRRFKRTNHSERLLTDPTHNGTKGTISMSSGRCCSHTHCKTFYIIQYK